jgi:hypothetical protein
MAAQFCGGRPRSRKAVGRGLAALSAHMLFALLATSPAAAQRAVLFDEDPSDPNGQRYVGSVTWHRNHQARLAIRRGRGTRRRRHCLAQIQNHAAAETQSRYIAAGEPRGRADVPFAARLCWWRHRQCTGNTDEIRRAGARDRTGRALRQGDGRFFYGRTVGYGYRARAQSAFVGMRAPSPRSKRASPASRHSKPHSPLGASIP